MIVEVLQPSPQTVNLSTGEKTVTINYRGVVTDPAKNTISLLLEIIDSSKVVFSDGSSNATWQQDMTTSIKNFQKPQTFMLNGAANGTNFCALEFTATDPDGVKMETSTHIVFF